MTQRDTAAATDGPPRTPSVLVHTAVQRRRALLIGLIALVPIGICHLIALNPDIDIVGLTILVLVLAAIAGTAQAAISYRGEALWPPSSAFSERFYSHDGGQRSRDRYHGSRLVRGLRWCLLIGGFAFFAGIFVAGISVAALVITSNIDLDVLAGGFGESIITTLIAMPTALVAGILLALGRGHGEAADRLVVICWILGLYNLVLWAVITGVYALVFEKREEVLALLLVIAWTGFLAISFAMLRLLYQQDRDSTDPAEQPTERRYNAINGNASLISARGFSLVLLLTLAVSIDIGTDQAGRLKLLQHARQLFATAYLMEVAKGDLAEANEALPVVLQTPKIDSRFIPGFMGSGTGVTIVEIEQANGETWRAEEIRGITSEEVTNDLVAIAAQIGVDPDDEFYPLFVNVQQSLIDEQKKVTLPLVGLPVASGYVTWALAGVTLVLLLLVRSRTRRIFLDPDLAVEQPWLVLDGYAGLERIAAMVWLFAVLLAPWLAHAALVVTFAAQNFAEGAPPDALRDGVSLGLMLALLLLSAWIASLTVTDLLWLRALRRGQLVIADDAKRQR